MSERPKTRQELEETVLDHIHGTYLATAYTYQDPDGSGRRGCTYLTDELPDMQDVRAFTIADALGFSCGWQPRPAIELCARLLQDEGDEASRALADFMLGCTRTWEELDSSSVKQEVRKVRREIPGLASLPTWKGKRVGDLAEWILRGLFWGEISGLLERPVYSSPDSEDGHALQHRRASELQAARRSKRAAAQRA